MKKGDPKGRNKKRKEKKKTPECGALKSAWGNGHIENAEWF